MNEFEEEAFFGRAFPHLFPTGRGDYKYPRLRQPTREQYIKYLMQYHDRRFVKDPRLCFFLLNLKMRHDTLSSMGVYFNRNRFAPRTVAEVKERLEHDPRFLNEVCVYAAKLRSSTAYWKQRCGELLDMVKQIGTPTVFITLSYADHHWPDLYRLLVPEGQDATQLNEQERRELMINNPDITTEFFYRRCDIFIKKILTPIFGVVDKWHR